METNRVRQQANTCGRQTVNSQQTVNMVNRRPTDSPQSPDRWNEVNSRPTEGKYPGNRREGTGADGSEQTQSVTQNKKYAVEFTHKRVGTSCKYNQSLGNRTGVPFVCEITSLNSRRYLNFIAFFFDNLRMQPVLELGE